MSVEWFLKLKEIDSLTKMKNNFLKNLGEHQTRLKKLEERRQERVMQSATLRQELVTTSNQLGELETKIKMLSEQKQRLIDIGGDDKKIASYANEISSFEEAGFLFLTRIDEIETELAEAKSFLDGLAQTISEISQEVNEEVTAVKKELENTELRIAYAMEEIPADYKSLLLKITAKNLAHGPFTRIDQGSCFFCRYQISRIEESEIDMQKSLKTCRQCGRIFLPYGA